MNTVKYVSIADIGVDLESIEIPEYNEDEQNVIAEYIEITRALKEADDLFHIHRANFSIFLSCFEMGNNDVLTRYDKFVFQESDEILINALTINCISAGKTLVESLERSVRTMAGEKSDMYGNFKNNYYSKFYDESFSYRFLTHIRNYSQHGHIPVTVENQNMCSFDLKRYLSTPHTKYNAEVKKQVEKIVQLVFNETGEFVNICFTRTLAEFNLKILQIYEGFLSVLDDLLNNLYSNLKELIERRSDIVYSSDDLMKGYVFYLVEDEIHCFDSKSNPVERHEKHKEELHCIIDMEEQYFQELIDSIKYVKVSDI